MKMSSHLLLALWFVLYGIGIIPNLNVPGPIMQVLALIIGVLMFMGY